KCATNECVFRKLKTGGRYSFRAQAVNRVGEGEWSDLSRSAQADTKPGRVQNIRMVDRGNGYIQVKWDPPTTDTSRILTYSISWYGGEDVVTGDTTTYTARGLNNNEKYLFTVKAQNRVDYSLPRTSSEMQPLGTPSPPPAPTVTDLESGPNQTDVRIGWQAVLPEGPGPTVYTVTYSNGGQPVAVPGCQKLVSLTCTHAGVPYDGLTYTYRVVASNQPANEPANRSVPSEPTSIEAVGRPAQWGPFTAVATGTSQEIQLQYTVPDSRGNTSRVEILVNGVLNKPFNQQTGTNTTRILVPNNEGPFQVQLRVCNEKAPAGCTLSGQQNVQSYGSLNGMLDDIGNPVVNGKNITWTVTGTSNGNPAELVYSIDGGPDQVINLPAVGGFSQQISTTTDDYVKRASISVTLRDSSPAGRGEDRTSRSDWSGAPSPGVGVSKGTSCRDDDADASNNCSKGGPNDPPACQSANCAFVSFSATGFYENFTCSVSTNGISYAWRSYSYGPTGTGQLIEEDTEWFAPAGATVTCTGTGVFGRQASGSATW
ncbi:MAG TPA: fibronectin type III domain-containing protein, partial [Nocardioides sp.]